MGFLDYANSQPVSRGGRSKKAKVKTTEERFWEAKQNQVKIYFKALDVADSIKLGVVKAGFSKAVANKQLARRKAPVIKFEVFGPFVTKHLANGLREVHIPQGISGKAYNKNYRDYVTS